MLLIPAREPFESYVLRDHVVGDQEILPRLAFVILRVVTCLLAPLNGQVFFGDNFGIGHLVFRLRLQHVNCVVRFGHEVRLVFGVVGAGLVINLELAFGGLEPLCFFTFQ